MKNSGIILGSLAADSLALGPHWIYDTAIIDKKFGRIDKLQQPLADSYHKTKNLGDFTHYGDQTLLLLKSLAETGDFELQNFSQRWQKEMEHYGGYLDGASKQTLKNLQTGKGPDECGSGSADLGGAARIAPLVYRYQNSWESLLDGVRKQTKFTHNNATVIAGAEVLARICWEVMQGAKPTEVMKSVVEAGVNDIDLGMRLQQSLDSRETASRDAIANFGQACGIAAGLPGVFHLVAKYEDNFETALVENVMAGGDSAARGLCVGMILGAYHGIKAVPGDWLKSMTHYTEICELIDKLENSNM